MHLPTLKIFLDTEFTDFFDPQLISLGMVTGDGEEFYVELPFTDAGCSAFVREAVIPLLGITPDAYCSKGELPSRLLSWLETIRQEGQIVEMCVDYQTDWDLFADALDYTVPEWCKPRSIARNINKLLRYEYHKLNNLPEHHALFDARASRYAFRERPPVSR